MAALLLVNCTPMVQKEQPELPPQISQAEEIGETEAVIEEGQAKISVVERLLPSGFLEIGSRDAPLVLMMYTEHHCRYCKDFQSDHFPKLHRDFIAPGVLRLQIGILPLKKYSDSELAAKSMLCAATQGKGMPMHEFLLEVGISNQELLYKHVEAIELDAELFSQCLESPDTDKTIERQKSLARSLNVSLVPTFFLDGEKSVGLPYYADLKGMIENKINQ